MADVWKKQLGEFPPDFLEEVAATIRPYHISLVHESHFQGSGTLIQCSDRSGILTAHHVVYDSAGDPYFNFEDPDDQIYLVIDEVERQLGIEAAYVRPHIIGSPVAGSEEKGPDMVFLEIPPGPKLDGLKAKKSFFKIDFDSENRLEFCLDGSVQFWALSNSLGEGSWTKKHPEGFVEGSIKADISFTGPVASHDEGDFDYIEMSVDYSSGSGIAKTFRGSSGGALWKIDVHLDEKTGKFEAKKTVLAGMAFYQTEVKDDRRRIICHWAKSIYRTLLSKLR